MIYEPKDFTPEAFLDCDAVRGGARGGQGHTEANNAGCTDLAELGEPVDAARLADSVAFGAGTMCCTGHRTAAMAQAISAVFSASVEPARTREAAGVAVNERLWALWPQLTALATPPGEAVATWLDLDASVRLCETLTPTMPGLAPLVDILRGDRDIIWHAVVHVFHPMFLATNPGFADQPAHSADWLLTVIPWVFPSDWCRQYAKFAHVASIELERRLRDGCLDLDGHDAEALERTRRRALQSVEAVTRVTAQARQWSAQMEAALDAIPDPGAVPVQDASDQAPSQLDVILDGLKQTMSSISAAVGAARRSFATSATSSSASDG